MKVQVLNLKKVSSRQGNDFFTFGLQLDDSHGNRIFSATGFRVMNGVLNPPAIQGKKLGWIRTCVVADWIAKLAYNELNLSGEEMSLRPLEEAIKPLV